MGYSKLALC